MRSERGLLMLAIANSATATGLVLLDIDIALLRLLLALPLVFVWSGFAINRAIFQKATLEPIELWTISIGISLAVTILGGLLLHWLPWGLESTPWVLLLASVTAGAAGIALFKSVDRTQPFRISFDINLQPVLLLSLALFIVGSAYALVRSAVRDLTPAYTQMWIQPVDGTQESFLRIGVENQEHETVLYKLKVDSGDQLIEVWESIELRPGEKWEETISAMGLKSSEPIRAKLYQLDDPLRIYRQVFWKPSTLEDSLQGLEKDNETISP